MFVVYFAQILVDIFMKKSAIQSSVIEKDRRLLTEKLELFLYFTDVIINFK